MSLAYTKHEKLSLKNSPEFNEIWLHDRICDDTAILGLSDLYVIQREKIQHGGGRLDNRDDWIKRFEDVGIDCSTRKERAGNQAPRKRFR